MSLPSPIMTREEPLLQEDKSRYVMFPIQDKQIWDMYIKQIDCFWRAEEIDLSKDYADWKNRLTEEERQFISMILAFFAASDGIVLENLGVRFMTEVQLSEARAFYGFQIAMENIHSQVYSLLIDTYITDRTVKNRLFNSLEEYQCIKQKGEWAIRWINDEASSFATRLVAFACIEGIFFSGAFCSIFWLKKRGLLPGLTFSNELISRDEALHTEFAILLYSRLNNRLTDQELRTIIREAVDIEQSFICEALPCRLIGMNVDLMRRYIEFVADRLYRQLSVYNAVSNDMPTTNSSNSSTIYNAKNPFDWMEMISIDGKTNFFEKKVSDYAMATKIENPVDAFEFSTDF